MPEFITDFPRRAAEQLKQALASFRVVTLVGARQTGKSTLAERVGQGERSWKTLDDSFTLDDAQRDPVGFINNLSLPVTIDEIQREPKLLLPIKVIVDRDNKRGQFLLTGSANILTLPKVSESLAGRVRILMLYPLAQSEIENTQSNLIDMLFSGEHPWKSSKTERSDLYARITRGGYPEAVLRDSDYARAEWFAAYIETLLQRELLEISRITRVATLRRLLSLVAARTARIVRFSGLASDFEMSARSVVRYVNLLEQMFITYRVPAWSGERGRRLIHAPKMFIEDSGLAAFLLRLTAEDLAEDPTAFGALLEGFVVSELRRHASWSKTKPDFYHYRTYNNTEIDLILEAGPGRRIGIEIKATGTLTHAQTKTMRDLLQDPKTRLQHGVIFYGGDQVLRLAENLHAIPISNLWNTL